MDRLKEIDEELLGAGAYTDGRGTLWNQGTTQRLLDLFDADVPWSEIERVTGHPIQSCQYKVISLRGSCKRKKRLIGRREIAALPPVREPLGRVEDDLEMPDPVRVIPRRRRCIGARCSHVFISRHSNERLCPTCRPRKP